MTDKAMADKVYIEPMTVEAVQEIIKKEHPDSLLPNLGGQTGLNLAMELCENGFLDKMGVKLLGANPTTIAKGRGPPDVQGHHGEDRRADHCLQGCSLG